MKVEIRGNLNEIFLSITLIDLLDKISQKIAVDKYFWSIYELYATGNVNNNINLPKLEKKIHHSEAGLIIDWDKLKKLAQNLEQVIDLILVCSTSQEKFTKFEDTEKWFHKYEIVVEIIDGDCWEIHTQNQVLINFLVNSYENVKLICDDEVM